MLDQGLIRQAGNGTFYLLPLLQRSLQKATDLVDLYMQRYVHAEKLSLPILTSADLWQKSGRLESAGAELMQTTDRQGKKQILGPVSIQFFVFSLILNLSYEQTHEESITALLAAVSPLSYRQCPLRLYQISTKFRDELRPRFGLMRAKEFVMKDLYTFDVGLAEAQRTYEEVSEAYVKLFDAIGVPYVKVSGDGGLMGGSVSHEYHYLSEVGEDQLVCCDACGMKWNQELLDGDEKCKGCGHGNVVRRAGIEVAHAFILEDKYSKVLGAKFMQQNGKPSTLQMGCYGIGITRLIAAGVEVLSSENNIRWPFALAPFKVCLIPPKSGSKEEAQAAPWVDKLSLEISRLSGLSSDVLIDDRTNTTIGKRLIDAKKTGYPIVIVIGLKASVEGGELFEIHNQMNETTSLFNFSEALAEIKRICDKYAQ